MNRETEMSANPLVSRLGKLPAEFTKADIIEYVKSSGIRMINFMYPAEDGRVKTLNFIVNNAAYLDTILSTGERVDGSSLFPSFVEPGNSDLYVIPRFRTAFLDPFAEIPTLCLLCSFYDKDGQPFACDPHYTLAKAEKAFEKSTGMTFEAMGELEYYVIRPSSGTFPGQDQRGYHESGPFAKMNGFRALCMDAIASAGGVMKYGHSEVGNFTLDGMTYEQNEIEFLPCPVESAADQLLIAKWIIRNMGLSHGIDVTFAPKISIGEAGSGLHVHMRLMKDGKNLMTSGGKLSDTAKRAIAGMLELAPAITAFGNKNPTSYFRLVPHQEAPTSVCWGDCNRSTLVRVPLGWNTANDMCSAANPKESAGGYDASGKQTVEMRSPDSSADIYQLMAGLCVACRYGLEMPEDKALRIAADKYAGMDIHKDGAAERFEALPDCCEASASCLEKVREVFEREGVFSSVMIDGICRSLRSFADKGLLERAKRDENLLRELVDRYFYCG